MVTKAIQEQFARGDKKAFDVIYSTFSPAMFGICLRYTRCRDDAQDVLQEAFIKIFRAAKTYTPEMPLASWIKKITINSALSYIKKNYRFILQDDESFFNQVEEIDLASDNFNELNQKLLHVLNQLPDGYRTIFNLFVIDNLTHKEISLYLEISENTSKTQFFKAKKMIKQLLISEKVSLHV